MQKEESLKRDSTNLAVLVVLALAIGSYLIATSELISRDGAFYISQARKLPRDPVAVARRYPIGYPSLLFGGHQILNRFADGEVAAVWIWSSQTVTLLCRVAALIPLYLLGRLLVGAQKSFWAILILIVLPYPARYGSDVLREWPFLLFLALGFWLLLRALRDKTRWLFALVGLSAGLGYLIRPMAGQLVVYALLGLIVTACARRRESKLSLIAGASLLLVAFAIPTVPYLVWTGSAVPQQFTAVPADSGAALTVESFLSSPADSIPTEQKMNTPLILRGADHVFTGLADNLMIFFLVPLCLGFYHRLRHEAGRHERALMIAVVVVNVGLLLARYAWFESGSARRYSLGLIVLTICYVPDGLQRMAHGLRLIADRFFGDRGRPDAGERVWFWVLLVVGVAICIPKLLAPMHADKTAYCQVAQWLHDNTAADSMIAVPDERILLLAERLGPAYGRHTDLSGSDYVVTLTAADSADCHPDGWSEVHSRWVDENRRKRLVVYGTR